MAGYLVGADVSSTGAIRSPLETHDGDCPRCVAGDHGVCLDNPEEGSPCGCAEGGHL